jgi:hypothetical protein
MAEEPGEAVGQRAVEVEDDEGIAHEELLTSSEFAGRLPAPRLDAVVLAHFGFND